MKHFLSEIRKKNELGHKVRRVEGKQSPSFSPDEKADGGLVLPGAAGPSPSMPLLPGP